MKVLLVSVAVVLFSVFARHVIRNTDGPYGFGSYTTADDVLAQFANTSLQNQVVLVTGANSGIGYETARALSSRGATVVVATRSKDKSRQTIASIIASEGSKAGKLVPLTLDLADLHSVKQCAVDFLALGLSLDTLILNAGIMALPERATTLQGFERQMGVNHLGHFALTQLLLPALKKAGRTAGRPARVITVSSEAHAITTGEGFLANPRFEDDSYKLWGWVAYGNSKLANILFAKELHHRHSSDGILSLVLHPGTIGTNLSRHTWASSMVKWQVWSQFLIKNIPQGAATTVYCAISPDVLSQGGNYFIDAHLGFTKLGHLVNDRAVTRKFWDDSLALVSPIIFPPPATATI